MIGQVSTVNIRPGVNVLSVLPHLNYKAWYALAEFVDNSIQSSIDRKKELKAIDGPDYKLRVDIEFRPQESALIIRDNAAGIASPDYARAFRPAEIPPDASGLSEFGMGMKSAACWFSPYWSVRSSALGEQTNRTVIFDIDQIVHDRIEELHVISETVAKEKHYTEIRLEKIRKFPRGKTIQKIKEHLASIYRIYIRDGELELYIDDERMRYVEPKVLVATCYRDLDGPPVPWKTEINIELGEGKLATGFVAIREVANTRLAGLALFRRKRLIMGSADEAYRPEDIFGRPNTYPFQRLFGEIHLRGFSVSHTKDGIKWEESEEDFLRKLRAELSKNSLPLIQQAREYRTKIGSKATPNVVIDALSVNATKPAEPSKPVEKTAKADSNKSSAIYISEASNITNNSEAVTEELEELQLHLQFRSASWIIKVELSYSADDAHWLTIRNRSSITDPDPREITIRLAMLSPFMSQTTDVNSDGFYTICKIAASMALAEVVAVELADRQPHAIRRYINEILNNHISRREDDE